MDDKIKDFVNYLVNKYKFEYEPLPVKRTMK